MYPNTPEQFSALNAKLSSMEFYRGDATNEFLRYFPIDYKMDCFPRDPALDLSQFPAPSAYAGQSAAFWKAAVQCGSESFMIDIEKKREGQKNSGFFPIMFVHPVSGAKIALEGRFTLIENKIVIGKPDTSDASKEPSFQISFMHSRQVTPEQQEQFDTLVRLSLILRAVMYRTSRDPAVKGFVGGVKRFTSFTQFVMGASSGHNDEAVLEPIMRFKIAFNKMVSKGGKNAEPSAPKYDMSTEFCDRGQMILDMGSWGKKPTKTPKVMKFATREDIAEAVGRNSEVAVTIRFGTATTSSLGYSANAECKKISYLKNTSAEYNEDAEELTEEEIALAQQQMASSRFQRSGPFGAITNTDLNIALNTMTSAASVMGFGDDDVDFDDTRSDTRSD